MISAALGLVGLGETGYGELVAGGLALGAGTEKNSQKAVAWLDYTAAEIEAGALPVSQDAGVERAAILRLVSAELVGGTGDAGGKVVLASNNTPTPVIETAVITPPVVEEEPGTRSSGCACDRRRGHGRRHDRATGGRRARPDRRPQEGCAGVLRRREG